MSNVAERYQVVYTDEAKRFLYRRRAATHAAFFLPYLRPGMHLLDCGCGPGSITTDLAAFVAPGEVIGIDLDPSQLTLAQNHAQQAGITNVHFEQDDVCRLRFPDQTFDAVFVHGVIEYLPDPVAAFAEIRRVLKIEGLLGTSHSDWGDLPVAPLTSKAARFFDLFQQFMRASGGEPKFGRHQLAALRAAGFERISPTTSCDCWTPDPDSTRFVGNFLAAYCASPEFVKPVTQLQLASEAELQEISAELRQWGENPAAFAAEPWCEAVAWRS